MLIQQQSIPFTAYADLYDKVVPHNHTLRQINDFLSDTNEKRAFSRFPKKSENALPFMKKSCLFLLFQLLNLSQYFINILIYFIALAYPPRTTNYHTH